MTVNGMTPHPCGGAFYCQILKKTKQQLQYMHHGKGRYVMLGIVSEILVFASAAMSLGVAATPLLKKRCSVQITVRGYSNHCTRKLNHK